MKKMVLLLIILLYSCGKISIDYGGSSDYYITNNRDTRIIVECILLNNGSNSIKNIEIDSGIQIYVLSDFCMGHNPKPSDSFKSIFIKDTINNEIVNFDPIDDKKWVVDKEYTGDFGKTNYYLYINEVDNCMF
jgi:hypothetical protein